MPGDTFHIRKSAAALAILRPKVDKRLAEIIAEMQTAADQLDALPEGKRGELLPPMIAAATELVDSLSELASRWPADPLSILQEAGHG
jgi:hypothetical protein